ncbi:MAG: cyclase family protein [Gaiellaceae bacterium]
MELIDVTVPIREGMVTYPGDPDVRLERVSAIAQGALANLSRLDFGVHSGTHVDAPVHFIDGAAGAESLPLEVLVGPAHVVDATRVRGVLDRAALGRLDLPEGKRLLFKTPNSELWASDRFAEESVHLTADGAELLVERGVRLVGLDYLSVGDPDAHRVLLGAGVVAVEGLDLREAEPGAYRLLCLPLKIVGSDGAPARAVLLRE